MEVYILDSLYRRAVVVDKYESIIWTERYSLYGDFILVLQSTFENRSRFTEGVNIAVNDSYYVMTVETIEDTVDADGKTILKISGRSLEQILDSRLASAAFIHTGTDLNPKWIITDTAVNIANKIFHDVCVAGFVNAGDIIPLVTMGSIFDPGTVPFPTDVITYEIAPKSVYAALKDLCDIYLLGFRLIRNLDAAQLYFDVYSGSDRTSHQEALPAVIFSPDLDNLQNVTELKSIALYKNVAYVLCPVGFKAVYAPTVETTIAGFDRRVLVVDASDITDDDPDIAEARMIQRGVEELAQNRRLYAFDGELVQNSQYVYGRDYFLGDLVEQRNVDGISNTMQVTEHIRSSDAQGEKSYPTLSITQTITPGSWGAEPIDEVWEDLPADDHWVDRP